MKLKLSRNQIYLILLSVLVFVAFYAMNHWAFIIRDDYTYSVFFESVKTVPNYGCERVQTFWDCMVSQYHHYQVWNGRVIIHTLVQYFSGVLGRGWFNWANTIVFLLFILGAARLTASDRKLRPLNLFLTFVFCWFLLPDVAETTIWIAGSVNYLWSTTLFLYFMLYYKRFATTDYPLWALPLLSLLGVLLGWTQEIPTLSILGGLVLTNLFVRRQWPNRQEWFFLIGFLIGIVGLCMAGGNASRIETTLFSFNRFFLELAFIAKNMFVSWLLLLGYLVYGLAKRKWHINFLKQESLLVGTMLSAMVLCLLLLQGVARMYFLADSLALVLLVRLIVNRFPLWSLCVKRLSLSLAALLFVVSLAVNIKGTIVQADANAEFNRMMIENRAVMSERILIKPSSRFSLLIDLPDFADPAYCAYHGLPRIEMRPEGLFDQISPVDLFCVETNRLLSDVPIYGTLDSDYWVLKLPKRLGEEINLRLSFRLKDRWDRSIRYKLGVMKPVMEIMMDRNFCDYSDGLFFYYFFQKSRLDYADEIVEAEVILL